MATSTDALKPATAPPFELQKYISSYSGNTLISRLIRLLNEHTHYASEIAPVLVSTLTKSTYQTILYNQLFVKYPSLGSPDEAWVSATEAQRKKEILHLREMLTRARDCGSDEVFDVYMKVGHFNCKLGDLGEACKNFVSAFERASGMRLLQCQLQLARVYLDSRDPQRALSTSLEMIIPESATPKEKKNAQGLKSFFLGVSHMCLFNFREAAENFLSLSYNQTFDSNVTTKSDVVFYGFLCMVASFDRSEVQRTIFGEMYPGFKRLLSTEPEIHNMALNFHHMHFAEFYFSLQSYQVSFKNDIYICGIEVTLLTTIRERSILQYFVPFSSLRLSLMAGVFDTPILQLEDELCSLIAKRDLPARIDRENMTLVRYVPSLKDELIQNTLDLGSNFQSDAMASLFQANATKANILVGEKQPARFQGQKPLKGRKDSSLFQYRE